jgi:nucleoside-diphosphate-sugar epimerase/predicted dehydrogenase
VLVEKPLSKSGADCEAIIEASARRPILGVNQNFVYHPAFARLKRYFEIRKFGNPRFVDVLYNVPLRQIATQQFGHWMFLAPENILLEQAIHPLSQLTMLCGQVEEMSALAEPPLAIGADSDLFASFTASFRCRSLPAILRFAVAETFPVWLIRVVCDDGVLVADMLANRFWTMGRTRWLAPIDGFLSGQRSAFEMAGDSTRNLVDYGLSTVRFKRRSDGFFRSMFASLQAFHHSIDNGLPPLLGAEYGRDLVVTCERLSDGIAGRDRQPRQGRPQTARSYEPAEIAVLGGTGFIGRQVVKMLAEAGRPVSVLARNTENLSAELHSPRVSLRRGDIRDKSAVDAAINGAEFVINLAHGGGGGSWEAVRDGMVGGAECVARACLAAGTKRFLHIGSIASLYLGPQRGAVTGSNPPDPHADRRPPYARAKAMCDLMLLEMCRRDGLPVCILRPGLVVGRGAPPLHSGLGFFNNEQHCIGWNLGRNPLPFVLVEDVAAAIIAAIDAKGIDGRCFNLVGDVRPTAREYVDALALELGRPLRFHPKFPASLFFDEMCKWVLKAVARRPAPMPSWRDIASRGLRADFDCADAKRELGWCPVADRKTFFERAIGIHEQMR